MLAIELLVSIQGMFVENMKVLIEDSSSTCWGIIFHDADEKLNGSIRKVEGYKFVFPF